MKNPIINPLLKDSAPKMDPVPRSVSQQQGYLLHRGSRNPVWVGRWRELVQHGDGEIVVRRTEILGTLAAMPREEAERELQRRVQRARMPRLYKVGGSLKRLPVTNVSAKARLNSYRSITYQIKRKYGLTRADVDAMEKSQGGRCAICKVIPKRFAIDHNHATNQTRALLCRHCNVGLGFFRDRPDVLRDAADYIESHNLNQ